MSKLTRGNSNALTGTRRGMLAAPDFQASHLSGACAGGGDPARQLRGNHQSRRGLHPGGEQLNHMAIGGTATRFSDGLRFAPPKIARGGASHAEACALFGMLGAAACFERTAYRHPRNRAPGCRHGRQSCQPGRLMSAAICEVEKPPQWLYRASPAKLRWEHVPSRSDGRRAAASGFPRRE